jgi:hypothetical protein
MAEILGARMTEPESVTQVRAGSEATRGKGGKGKAVIKGSKSETPPRGQSEQPEQAAGGRSSDRQPERAGSGQPQPRDVQVIARIQQRAYGLFEAGGFEHGHDLEHWLEAERQITDSSER